MRTVNPQPRVVSTPGGWLALSPDGEYPRIGVMGETEQDAIEKFHDAVAGWLALREEADRAERENTTVR